MKSIRFILACDKGFTITELLVVSFLGLIMLALTLSATISNRRLYKYDLVRTKTNQNLRSALDIIGIDVREAGENLPSTFPAIEIINGGSGAPDQLIIRRNLLDESFNFCQAIAASSNNTQIIVADNSITTQGCDKTSNATAYGNWSAHLAANSNSVNAYAYDRVARLGEFIRFTGVVNNSTQYQITRSSGTWTNAYAVGSANLYVLEEWKYRILNNTLQIIVDQDTANALDVVDNVNNFQVIARLQSGATQNSFGVTDNWSTLESLEISISGLDSYEGSNIQRTLSSRFFPRNILSN